MFKRKIYSKMQEWKKESDGKTALLIEGARRIGKSTVVEEFAKNEYESYILIDFSRASKETRELFEDVSDLNFLFLQLQLQYKVDLKENQLLYSMRFNFAHRRVKPLKHWLPITDMITLKPDHLFRLRKM